MSVYIVNYRRAVAHLYREVKKQRNMFYRRLFRDYRRQTGRLHVSTRDFIQWALREGKVTYDQPALEMVEDATHGYLNTLHDLGKDNLNFLWDPARLVRAVEEVLRVHPKKIRTKQWLEKMKSTIDGDSSLNVGRLLLFARIIAIWRELTEADEDAAFPWKPQVVWAVLEAVHRGELGTVE